MGKRTRWIIIMACMALGFLAGRGIAMARMAGERAKERRYPLSQLGTANLSLTGDGITIGEDPQILLPDIHVYVKGILLVGLETAEEIQVFYADAAGEAFSEGKSIRAVPKIWGPGTWQEGAASQENPGTEKEAGSESGSSQGGVGAYLPVDRDAASLRIDLTGASGSSYCLSAIVLNPVRAAKGWDEALSILFSLLIGGLVGLLAAVLATEGRNLPAYIGAFRKYRYLLEDMVARDIKLKYRRSVIGFLWSVLNLLLMMCVITAVFRNLFRLNVENFAVYYLTGWCVFNFVTEATSGAMTSILGAGALIRKVYIPKYIFPVQKCLFSFMNMLFSLAALFVVMILLRERATWRLLLIPIPLLLALAFSVGLGMALATAAVFFRDVIHLYTVFMMAWMYLTPVIYPEDILSVGMLRVVRMNPMYYYVDAFRKLVMYHAVPGVREVLVMAAWASGSLLVGAVIFKGRQDRFILFI